MNRSASQPARSWAFPRTLLLVLATMMATVVVVVPAELLRSDARSHHEVQDFHHLTATSSPEPFVHQDRTLLADDDSVSLVQEDFVDNDIELFQDDLTDELHRALQTNLANCVAQATQVDYFSIEVAIQTQTTPTNCMLADTIMLGHDINLIIHNQGIDIAEQYDNVAFIGKVCPVPSTSGRRREMLEMTAKRFIWVGSGGCSYCKTDNLDRRHLASQWFVNTFKPLLEQTLRNKINNEIVPKYRGCLGVNPTIIVDVQGKDKSDLSLSCSLRTYSLDSIVLRSTPSQKCGQCSKVDWSTKGNGSTLRGGDWVRNQWLASHGFTVKAFPNPSKAGSSVTGYAPSNQARIYDTQQQSGQLDWDLGSPNSRCSGGGPGEGIGGEPGMPGENCKPLGNALIIQQSDSSAPNDYTFGGTIQFDFNPPVFFSDIGLIDIDEVDQRLKFTYADGTKQTFSFVGFGDNSVQRVIADKSSVVRLEVVFPKSGGITEINFCPTCN